MVHNPIYSGPEYESIHPQYETLQLSPHQQQTGSSTPECSHTPSTDKLCQPHFDQALSPLDSQFPSELASCYSS